MYTYDQALSDSVEYFNGDELAAKVFVDKYALRKSDGLLSENSPSDMHSRIAKNIARIQKRKYLSPLLEQQIFDLLDKFKYIVPQGSPMYGIGNPNYVSIGNCFVLDPPEDTYNSILATDEQLVQISKRRGGVGIDLSKLRPVGSSTNNSSNTSTGVPAFMERYSNSIREVGQAGRRGALMESLSVHHPDVEEFATIKKDKTKVTGANISVRLTDEFLKAVENDEEYIQRWPVTGKAKIKRSVSARKVWHTLISSAHEMAEPGLLFWDNIIKESPADCYENFQSVSTNPCQPGWAKVLKLDHGTGGSITNFEDVSIGDQIWSKEGWTTVTNKIETGVKEVFKYSTTAGVFYGTDKHRLVVNNENLKQEAGEAESIEIITGPSNYRNKYGTNEFFDSYVMDGLVLGDGSVHKASGDLIGLYIGDNDKDYFQDPVNEFIIKHRPGINPRFYEVRTSIKSEELGKMWERRVPNFIMEKPIPSRLAFLRGLYSANGSVCGNRVTLKSTSKGLIEDVQLMLSSLGIRSYYTTNKKTKIEFENGEYECKISYDLNISTDRGLFLEKIGFIQNYKNEKIEIKESNRIKTVFDIVSIESMGEHPVYDITVSNPSHTYWTQGCNVSNCAELPLSAMDACRLLCLNLLSYVKNPYTSEAKFDFKLFFNHSKIAARMMDDIVDLEEECIKRIIGKIDSDPDPEEIKSRERSIWERILESCVSGRRCGLGITALGDALASLGLSYGSDESIEVSEKIYQTLKLGSYTASVEMAEELGTFEGWDYEKEKSCPFLKRFKKDILEYEGEILAKGKDLYERMKVSGRRNIALLTIAPTGSVSTMTQTTSGVEPAFMLEYTRRKKGNPGDNKFRVDFVDSSGDSWMEFKVYHPQVAKWMEITGETDIEKSPWYGCCAPDLDWTQRVRLQSALQKHCDHSISSTVNLPNDATVDQVKEIYETAWKAGCKGVTVYRDGCRTGVLVNDTKSDNTVIKRPDDLPCEVYHISVKTEPYFVLIGLVNGKPYEVFAGRNGCIEAGIKTGIIHKVKRPKCYRATFDDGSQLQPITAACSDNEEALTRMISMSLRHGAEINYVVDQLQKTQGSMTSLAKAIARALKRHVPEGAKSSQKCAECGSSMIFEEGCNKCPSCGASKCS